MTRTSLAMTLTIAALATAAPTPAQTPTLPPDQAAAVADRPIAIATFQHWMMVAASSQAEHVVEPPDPPDYVRCKAAKHGTDAQRMRACSREWGELRDQVIQYLISSAWIEAQTAADGITVTDAEVQRSFDRTRKENFKTQRAFDDFLAKSGMTMDDLLYRVRINLLSEKMRRGALAGVRAPAAAQVRAYYRKHKRSFRRPRLHEAVVAERHTRGAAVRVAAAIRAGRSWRSQHGLTVSAETVPDLPRLAKAIRRAPRGVLSGPVRSGGNWYVFELRHVRPPHQLTYREARRGIRTVLLAAAQDRALEAFIRDFHARWHPLTICRKPYVSDDCATIVD